MADDGTADEPRDICAAFWVRVSTRPDEIALRTLNGDEVTWRSYGERVRTAAAALHAIGVRGGDTVALLLTHRPEFHVLDMAALCLRAIPFSLYSVATAEDVAYQLADAGAAVVVTEQAFRSTMDAATAADEVGTRTVLLLDGPDAVDLQELAARDPAAGQAFDAEVAAAGVSDSDVATIIYTSGTTGPPKGVQLTHANIVALTRALTDRARLGAGMRVVSYLPMAHIAERLNSHYFQVLLGLQATLCPDPARIGTALATARPQFFFAPPRLWEKLRAAITTGPDADRHAAVQQMGFSEVECAYVGSSPVPPELVTFWRDLGVPLTEEYGLSECTGIATANPLDAVRTGTVGLPLPGVEIALAPDGEVLVRGANVMSGYWNQPAGTAEAIRDGWLHTGDLGSLDGDGYLRIIDRKKELIINSMGKNMSPSNIEARLKASCSLIGQVCVLGNDRPYNVALVVLDPDSARALAARESIAGTGVGDWAHDERIRHVVDDGIAAANADMSTVERVQRFHLLDVDWLPGGSELTPTMKLRRTPIAGKYEREVEELYAHR